VAQSAPSDQTWSLSRIRSTDQPQPYGKGEPRIDANEGIHHEVTKDTKLWARRWIAGREIS